MRETVMHSCVRYLREMTGPLHHPTNKLHNRSQANAQRIYCGKALIQILQQFLEAPPVMGQCMGSEEVCQRLQAECVLHSAVGVDCGLCLSFAFIACGGQCLGRRGKSLLNCY